MVIGGLQKVSLIDYPGRVAATVFTSGCNFSCPFCHNPELVDSRQISRQPFFPQTEFFDFLKSRQGLIDGVCITGGEPAVHKDLPEFVKKIKDMGFLVKLDTNGTRPEVLQELLKDKTVDYLAMDIKGPLENYSKITGTEVDLEKINQSTLLSRKFPDYEFRTTVVPGLHKKNDFLNIARWLDGSKKYFLQQFRPKNTLMPDFEKVKPYADSKLLEYCQMIKPFFDVCEVRI